MLSSGTLRTHLCHQMLCLDFCRTCHTKTLLPLGKNTSFERLRVTQFGCKGLSHITSVNFYWAEQMYNQIENERVATLLRRDCMNNSTPYVFFKLAPFCSLITKWNKPTVLASRGQLFTIIPLHFNQVLALHMTILAIWSTSYRTLSLLRQF